MNINNVYLANIYVKTFQKDNTEEPISVINTRGEGIFVKKALVYDYRERTFPVYIDIESGKWYMSFKPNGLQDGELYININEGLIPYKELIGTNKNNMSKRKILNKFYNSVKNTKK